MNKTIYGGKPRSAVAYCALHDGVLTAHEMKMRGCLGKQCRHLQKYEDHPFWKQREALKSRKLERRNAESCAIPS